jgi:hypothetical protein
MQVHTEKDDGVRGGIIPQGLDDVAGDGAGKIPPGMRHDPDLRRPGQNWVIEGFAQKSLDLLPTGRRIVGIPTAGKGGTTRLHERPPFMC